MRHLFTFTGESEMRKDREEKAFMGVKKNPFKDPIRPTEKVNGTKEWSFKAPAYDQRTSCSIPGGDSYGVGFTNPIGTTKVTPITSGPIPQKSMCFSPDEVI